VTTRIDDKPRTGAIYWTAYTDLEGDSAPTDPLRFDMYTQRLGNILLPGITNRTERLRYLSMVCAGLAQTIRGGSVREQRKAFLPFERGWVLAMTLSVDGRLKIGGDGPGQRGLRPEFRGLRGANRVLAHFRTLGDRPRVRPPGYTLLQAQDAQGGLGAYLITLREFGFVHPESLALTAPGRELAASFSARGVRGGRLSVLAADAPADRRLLARMGHALTLGTPSDEERQFVRAAVFEHDRSVVANVVRRMRTARPNAGDPETLLAGIARRDGDRIERAAAFALAFDPLRVAASRLFARLGQQLVSRPGSTPVRRLDSEPLEPVARDVRDAAGPLSELGDLDGLEPVSQLARDIRRGNSLEETVGSIAAFHRREERSWIVADGVDRYRVGRHGRFQEPSDDFNGYTVGRAFSLLADVEGTA
jgi:hypothetical protein